MKSVMKKVFSLLLVGLVTVSMFSFITPNRVDAKVELSNNYVSVKVSNFYDIVEKGYYYRVTFFDYNGEIVSGSFKPIMSNNEKKTLEEDFYVPCKKGRAELVTMKFEALTPKTLSFKSTKTTFTARITSGSYSSPTNVLEINIRGVGISMCNDPIACQIYNYRNEFIQ